MTIVKTCELEGAALDWAVAKCEGYNVGVLTTEDVIALQIRDETDPQKIEYLKELFKDTPAEPCFVDPVDGYKTTISSALFSKTGHAKLAFSANPNQAYQIIERGNMSIIRCDDDYGTDEDGFCNSVRIPVWGAVSGQYSVSGSTEHQAHDPMYQIYASDIILGPTPLIAAMRCYVAKELGETIDVPEELLK